MQLNPRENFTIARGLEDHRDSTVYYVRAVVRNAQTDALLATVDLTNQGDNHRYSHIYQLPADPLGQGFYILVTTSVYTDAGYTTKSNIYLDRYDTYLVMQRVNPNLAGIGGGVDIDYKRIDRIVDKVVEEKLSKLKLPAFPDRFELPAFPEVDLSEIRTELKSVQDAIRGIKMPEIKPVDLSGMIEKIEKIRVMAANPVIEDRQLKPFVECLEKMEEMLTAQQEALEQTQEQGEEILEKMKKFFGPDVDALVDGVEKLTDRFEDVQFVVVGKKGKVEEDD
jgi:hypothetical protein